MANWPKVGFLGCGNMGGALLKGMIASRIWNPEDLCVLESNTSKSNLWKKEWGVSTASDVSTLLEGMDAVIIAVKPQIFPETNILKGFCDFINTSPQKKYPVLISLMAGLSSTKIRAMVGDVYPVVRTMPNLPLSVGKGVTAIESGVHSEMILKEVEAIFQSAGTTVRVTGVQMDAVTGLSGSGPMYTFEFINSLIQAGIVNGLSEEISKSLVIQTVKGALDLLESSEESPVEWTKKVCSKGGTTLEGLKVLQQENFQKTVINAVSAATKRSIELGS